MPPELADSPDAGIGAIRPRALVVQTGFLGDVALASALLSPLEQAGYEVYALVTPAAQAMVSDHPALAGVLVDDKRHANRGLRGLVEMASALRRMGFALAISPHRSHRTSMLLWMAGIPRRVGFASSPLPFLLTEQVTVTAGGHQLERNHRLLAAAGIPAGPPRMSLRMGEETQREAQGMLRGLSRPLIGVAPGSAWATKRWPPEQFAAALRSVSQARPDATAVILGAPAEREAAAQIMANYQGRTLNLVGSTRLDLMCALIEKLDLLISNDSAPVHIAGAYRIPTVAIFLATHPRFGFGPFLQPYRIAQREMACRPCSPHGGARCPLGHFNCARKLDPVAVAEYALELLAPAHHGVAGNPSP